MSRTATYCPARTRRWSVTSSSAVAACTPPPEPTSRDASQQLSPNATTCRSTRKPNRSDCWSASAFEPCERNAPHQQPLTEPEHRDHRQGGNDRRRHQLVPLRTVLLHEYRGPQLNGPHVIRGGNEERPQESVPSGLK